MRLAAKIIVAFLLGSVALLVVDGALIAKREIRLFEEDAESDAIGLGLALQAVVGDLWDRHGREEALHLMKEIDQRRPLFSILWIDPSDLSEIPLLDSANLQDLLAGEPVVLRPPERGATLIAYFPLRISGGLGVIQLTESLSHVDTAIRTAILRIALMTAGLSGLALLLASSAGYRIVGRRLQRLTEQTRRIGRDEEPPPLHLAGHDELSELAVALNDMTRQLAESRRRLTAESRAKIDALEQLRHEDRLRTVGQLAAGMAHELGTPLNVVQGRADLLMRNRSDDEGTQKAAETIKAQVRTMTRIVQQLLDFARRQEPQKSLFRPVELADEVIGLLRPIAKKRQVELLRQDHGPIDPLEADPRQIRQVLTNLVMNAIHATPGAGSVHLEITEDDRPEHATSSGAGPFLCFRISDGGKGIGSDDLPHIFDPFFTTKDVGQGTGLGLSIAHGIVREHGGYIEVESEPGSGSSFSIYLPKEPSS